MFISIDQHTWPGSQREADIGEAAQRHIASPVQYLGHERAGLAQPPGELSVIYLTTLHSHQNVLGDIVDQLLTGKRTLLRPAGLLVLRVEKLFGTAHGSSS